MELDEYRKRLSDFKPEDRYDTSDSKSKYVPKENYYNLLKEIRKECGKIEQEAVNITNAPIIYLDLLRDTLLRAAEYYELMNDGNPYMCAGIAKFYISWASKLNLYFGDSETARELCLKAIPLCEQYSYAEPKDGANKLASAYNELGFANEFSVSHDQKPVRECFGKVIELLLPKIEENPKEYYFETMRAVINYCKAFNDADSEEDKKEYAEACERNNKVFAAAAEKDRRYGSLIRSCQNKTEKKN